MDDKLILLVDDEQEICAELSLYLSKKGYSVILAENGKEALELFKQKKPVLVLTDYKMPKMNGLELLKNLKTLNPDIHVILLSGVADTQTIVEAMKAEAFDFLSKPVDLGKLNNLIKTAIERTKMVQSGMDFQNSNTCLFHEIPDHVHLTSILYFNVDIDQYTSERYFRELNNLLSEGALQQNVIFIMKQVDYINTIGFNTLIMMKDLLTESSYNVFMCNVQDLVKYYLETLGYMKYFNIESNIENIMQMLH